jgi:hypothetical protein
VSESEAAAILRQCRAELAARDSTLISEVSGGQGALDEWRHYPDGEVYDRATHAQYFYHRHPPASRAHPSAPAEHGHFHLFLRGEGMPSGVTPLLLPELAVANAPAPRQSAPLRLGASDRVCHLVALALDERGEPLSLFTTNRWVTGETWYRADDVIGMLDRFRVTGERPSTLVNRWLGAFVRLFRADIAQLLRQRDKAIVERRWRSRANALEDERLEITSSVAIDLEARLAAIERRADAATAAPPGSRARPLPRMADGWGR